MRTDRLVQRYGLEVRWTHFPLHPETPPEGMTLEALFAGRGFDLEAAQEQMRQRMAAEGLPYGQRTMTFNSRLAQELGAWADTQPGGGVIHDALFRLYFVEGENLAQPEVLLALVERLELDVEAARQVLSERSFSEHVDRDWERSRRLGVTGVPTFVAGRQGVAGAQPYEELERLVVAAGATSRR